jgi:hypothetical protein
VAAALVQAGCDTILRNKNGMTGRETAMQYGHTAVVRAIDATGASRAAGEPQPEPAHAPAVKDVVDVALARPPAFSDINDLQMKQVARAVDSTCSGEAAAGSPTAWLKCSDEEVREDLLTFMPSSYARIAALRSPPSASCHSDCAASAVSVIRLLPVTLRSERWADCRALTVAVAAASSDCGVPQVPNIRHSRDSGRGSRDTAAVVSGCGGSETGD